MRRLVLPTALTASFVWLGVAAGSPPAKPVVVGRQSDGSVVTSVLQRLTPLGKQVELAGRANRSALSPDGRTLAVVLLEADKRLVLVDVPTGKVRQSVDPGAGASHDGVAWTPDGRTLLTSLDNGTVGITPISGDGLAGKTVQVAMPKVQDLEQSDPVPGGIATDGTRAYVALSRSNSLAVLDLARRTVTGQVSVGNAPHSVVLVGTKAYVSDEAGRPATAADRTDVSGGTQVVTNGPGSGTSTGTVDVVDLRTMTTRRVAVGLHPTSMTRSGRYLFVVNTNSDSLSVLDTTTDTVVQTLSLRPFPSAPYGSSPTDVAVVGGHEVFVSLGRNNAVAAYDWRGPSEPARQLGLLPVAEYPSAVEAVGGKLVVTNLKGVGSVRDADAHAKQRTVGAALASVSILPLPTASVLSRGTAAVAHNNGWDRIQSACPRSRVAPSAVPARLGEPSPIKHVVYVIKENRTYDQVMGDDARGNGDTSLAVFGKAVTPNQHAMARRWSLFDNYYASGRRSNDGHNWAVQADVPDYLEEQLTSRRSTTLSAGNGTPPSSGWDAMLYLPSGFLWENVLRAGLTFADFGEYTSEDVNPPARTDIASLRPWVAPEFPGFNLQFPDATRADLFTNRLHGWAAQGSMPSLTALTLSNDHTGGSDPRYPTPQSQVADNDLGTGKILDAISHSPFWSSTAVFVEEDDSQGGPDHVDGHRSTLFIASPYAKRGGVISTAYNQVSVVKTIEQILGLPAMNQLDLAAQPIREAFTATPDLTPYDAITPVGSPPLSNVAATPIQKEWAVAMGFQDLTHLDAANEQLLNRSTWYAATGWTRPYPGDTRILHPAEVGPSQRAQGLPGIELATDRPAGPEDRSTGAGLAHLPRVSAHAAVPGCGGAKVVPRARAGLTATGRLASTGLPVWPPLTAVCLLVTVMIGARSYRKSSSTVHLPVTHRP